MIVASPACCGAPTTVSLFVMPCTPDSRLPTISEMLVLAMAKPYSKHVPKKLREHEAQPEADSPVSTDFPALFAIPERGLTDRDGARQKSGNHRKAAHDAAGERNVAK